MLRRLRAAMTPTAMILLAAIALIATPKLFENRKHTDGLEGRLKTLLSRIEGAGSVDVMILMQTEDEEEYAGIFRDDKHEAYGKPCGAAVVAQGAWDPVVCMRLLETTCTLLGLPASAVSVTLGE